MNSAQLCTFRVDDLFFGVDVQHIQEVIKYQELTPVPLANRTVRGLINLRGEIVTAIDLRRRLNLEPNADIEPMNVVVCQDDEVVSFLVDESCDVIEVYDKDVEKVPETINGKLKSLIDGVYKLEGRLLLVLDTDKVTALDEHVN